MPPTRSKIAVVHIPRTGGTALGSHFFHQTRSDLTYFFSFFGLDSSEGKNRVVVERLQKGDDAHRALLNNAHFLASRLITGHFSYDLGRVFDEFEFQWVTVVREPIDRSISLIYKYALDTADHGRFGAFKVPSKSREPAAFWTEILRILKEYAGQPIPGLMPHESMMLFDGMSHSIGGTPLHTFSPTVDFDRVMANVPAFKFGLFERFNETVGALLKELSIPVTLNERTNYGGVDNPAARARHAPYYAAPEELIELVRSRNQNDLRLYEQVYASFRSAAA